MDGTLLNTEDIYTEASTQVLAKYGKGPLTWDIKLKLQGLPAPEAAKKVLQHYEIDVTPEEFMKEAFAVQTTLWPKTAFLDGAWDLLRELKAKKVPMALGTSSNSANYAKKTVNFQREFSVFDGHIVRGDDPRIPPGRGKPNPDIWHICLQSINDQRKKQGLEEITIEECLIFEDGIPGVISGLNSKATVIWIPHPDALKELDGKENEILPKGGEIIRSLTDFEPSKYGL